MTTHGINIRNMHRHALLDLGLQMSSIANLKLVHIEPVKGCNLRCKMCHVNFEKPQLQYLDIDSIDWEFCRDKYVKIGALYEPLIHPKANELISRLNAVNATLFITTNAHNLNKKELPALMDSKIGQIWFSFDGITASTYETIRVGGNYHQTIENIVKFVEKHKASGARFSVNMTVMKKNLEEVPDAPKFWNDIGIHTLGFISMVVRENDQFVLENNLYDVKDAYIQNIKKAVNNTIRQGLKIAVSSPHLRSIYPEKCPDGVFAHQPTFSDYRSIHNIIEFNPLSPYENGCFSPLSAVQIDWKGSLKVCQNAVIGSLLEHSFDELWNSDLLSILRARLGLNPQICQSCDYFNLCINNKNIDGDNSENYFSAEFKRKYPDIFNVHKGA